MGAKEIDVLLIDDHEPTNYYNSLMFEKLGYDINLSVITSAREALTYLATAKDGQYPNPDIIFLDVNMPGMNGWEFLLEYELLKPEQQGQYIYTMISTPLNEEDQVAAIRNRVIHGFQPKPLSRNAIQQIMEEHFPEVLQRKAASDRH